eukprot:s3087_g7.t1
MFVIFPSAARKRDMLLASIEILAESMGRANVRQFEAADMKMNVLRRPHYAKPGMRDGACIAVLIVFALDFECWSCDQPVLNSAAPMFKYWEQGCRNMAQIEIRADSCGNRLLMMGGFLQCHSVDEHIYHEMMLRYL